MTPAPEAPRRFLFLQGPPGPFFAALAAALAARGCAIHRINLCGGDQHDWPGHGLCRATPQLAHVP